MVPLTLLLPGSDPGQVQGGLPGPELFFFTVDLPDRRVLAGAGIFF
jgi:hypothetical protein